MPEHSLPPTRMSLATIGIALACVILLGFSALSPGSAAGHKRVSYHHLGFAIPNNWTTSSSDGNLLIHLDDNWSTTIGVIKSGAWDQAITNETLHLEMKKEILSFGASWSIFEAPRNLTIHGTLACDATLKGNFIGGIGYTRLIVLADGGWKTAWSVGMHLTYPGPIHYDTDEAYRSSPRMAEANSTIASLTVEGQDMTQVVLYVGFAAAVIFAMAAPMMVKRLRHSK